MQEKKPETYRLSSPSRRLRGSLASYILVTKHRDKIATFYKHKTRASTRTHAQRKMFASKLASTSQIAGQKLVSSSSSSSSRKPVSRGALQVF
jgi:hypothetical protein